MSSQSPKHGILSAGALHSQNGLSLRRFPCMRCRKHLQGFLRQIYGRNTMTWVQNWCIMLSHEGGASNATTQKKGGRLLLTNSLAKLGG